MNNIVEVISFKGISNKNNHQLILSETGYYHISVCDEKEKIYEFYPSQILSNIIGVNIHTEWDLSFLKDRRLRKYTEYTNAKYKKLLSLNPELFTLHNEVVKNEYDELSIWQGAVSKFNIDDISYFLAFECYDRPVWIERGQRNLEKYFKYSFQWVLGPETINKITRALNRGEIKNIDLTLNTLNFYE